MAICVGRERAKSQLALKWNFWDEFCAADRPFQNWRITLMVLSTHERINVSLIAFIFIEIAVFSQPKQIHDIRDFLQKARR